MDPNSPAAEGNNAGKRSRIPASRRARIGTLLAVAAVVGIAVGVAAASARSGGSATPSNTAASCPRLTGAPPLVVRLPGPPLRRGAPVAAIAAAAAARLPAGDLRVRVAALVAAYPTAGGAATVAALRRLPQTPPVVVTNLGLADLWSCRVRAAVSNLERAKRLDPYGFYGTAADNALHLGDIRGYPMFVPPRRLPARTLAQLRAAVAARPRSVGAMMALAAGLQYGDRPAAITAVRRAAALTPTAVSPQVAVAVLTFDKDNPQATIAALQQLAGADPNNAEVSFHLGLVELWVGRTQDAQAQFAQIVHADPNGYYTRFAEEFQRSLSQAGGAGGSG